MKRHLPGYCINVFNRVQVDADGTITPCAYATDDDLVLGRLGDQELDEIWNSPNAQDLRRGMLTWDSRASARRCMFTDVPARRSTCRSCARRSSASDTCGRGWTARSRCERRLT